MSATSIIFFLFGAVVLWGGLATTLTIAIKDGKK
ncbi:MetS family NSS transporter small subunit [Geosporobacter subterraneus]|nr:MetS family NSS transporter small subunit [Geosporobacter subterraneus]